MIVNISSRTLMLLAVLVLPGCMAHRAFVEGQEDIAAKNYVVGLGKLEKAAAEKPQNLQYRMTLLRERDKVINALLLKGDVLFEQGNLVGAEQEYRQVLAIESNNATALDKIGSVEQARRHQQLLKIADENMQEMNLAEADKSLRTILAENPRHKSARQMQNRLYEASALKQQKDMKLNISNGEPVALQFVDAPLRAVFDALSQVSGLSFIYDKDVRTDVKVSLDLKKASVEDSIDLLLVTNQLEKKIVNAKTILVYPNTPQKIKDYQSIVVRSFFLSNADAKQVANTLKTLLKVNDIVVDEKLNMVLIRDSADVIRLAEKIVGLQDLGEPEVMLEVEVLEVKRTKLLELGIKYPEQVTLSAGAGSGALFTLQDLQNIRKSNVTVSPLSVTANLKKEDQDTNILANPRIRVRNREKAKILIGDKVPVITTTSTSTGFVADSVSYVDVGLKLDVEPTIYLDDELAIKINLEVSSLVREVISRSGTLSYQIGTRSASTVLQLRDGETQVLAGLINDEDRASASKIPGLGELPLLGRLFSSYKTDRQKTEIVLSITPHLVRNIQRPELAYAEFSSGTASTIRSPEVLDSRSRTGEGDVVKPNPESSSTLPPVIKETALALAQPIPAAETRNKLQWSGMPPLHMGEIGTLALLADFASPLQNLTLLFNQDPAIAQIVSVEAGEWFRQQGGQLSFHPDPLSGHVVVKMTAPPAAVHGKGPLLVLTLRGIAAGDSVIKVVPMDPAPNADVSLAPAEYRVVVVGGPP